MDNLAGPFSALNPRCFSEDRFYRVYVTADAVTGVLIGGQFHSAASVRVQLSPLYLTVIGIPVVEVIASAVERRRLQREQASDQEVLVSGSVVADPRDLRIVRDDIAQIEWSCRLSWRTVLGWLGRPITIVRKDGGRVVLLVANREEHARAVEQLRAAGYPIQCR